MSRPEGGVTPSVAVVERRRRVLGLVGVALLLLLFSAFLLRPQAGDPASPPAGPGSTTATPSVSSTSASSTSASSTGASSTGPSSTDPTSASEEGTGPAPAVIATPKAGAVDFAFRAAGSLATDTFRVHVGPTPADAEEADPVTVRTTSYTVKVAAGTPMCVVASVVRSDQVSAASPAVCATAR